MNPALSVLLFTTLSGAGLGLLMWASMLWALSPALAGRSATIAALCVGGALLSTGLGFSFFHLGQPLRAWRAFSQWRTSWLSREAVVAVATLLATGICVVAVWRDHRGLAVQLAAAVLASLALLTVIATAGIYASLKPIRAWNNGFVAPFLVSAAMWSGGCLLWLVFAVHGMALPPVGLLALLLIAGASLGIKLRYWLFIDAAADRADAVHVTGLGGNSAVRPAEAPHTESNYLLREMGFVVARRHARRLRLMVMVGGFAVPAAALLFAQWLGRIEVPFAALACLAVIGALFIERWLFFAQARHAVVGYYR